MRTAWYDLHTTERGDGVLNPPGVSVAVLLATSALAQVANSRLEGVVQDSSGAVIPAASVVAVDDRTGVSTRTAADGQGFYVFLSLTPGDYTVTIGAPGLRQVVLTRVILNAAATVAQNVRLEIGPVTESITIEARETAVQTTDSQVGRVVELRDIEIAPQLERNPITLAIFQPGVQTQGGNIGFSRINGTRLGSNAVRVDGISATERVHPALSFSGNLTTTDSIQEFRIVTHGGKAEYGNHAGAQVEMITRSGTNRWSGNAFDDLRNTALNANDFFSNSSGVEQPKFIQNVFGGSVGGPVIPGRTFLFATYEGVRSRQEVVRNRAVLTATARAGLFRWAPPGSTAIQAFDIPGSDSRKMGIDPGMAALIKLTPAPNNFDIGDGLNTGGYRFNSPSNAATDIFSIRADHEVHKVLKLFARFSWLRTDYIDSLNSADTPFPGQPPGTASVRPLGYSVGLDWTLSPRVVNELRFGRYGGPLEFVRPARIAGPMLNPNSFATPLSTSFGSSGGAVSHELTDNVSTVRGPHLLKAGLNSSFVRMPSTGLSGIYPDAFFGRNFGNIPAVSIGPPASAISSADRARFELLYNDLLAKITRVSQTFYSDLRQFQLPGTARVRNFRTRDYGFFVQDDWKVRRNLTLNLGLRYEFSGVPSEGDGLQGTVTQAAQINNASQISDLAVVRSGRWYDNDFNNLAPRVGVAWDPWGDGKTAVRAQYGIFYDALIGSTTNFIDANTPGFSQVQNVYPNLAGAGSDVRASDGIPVPVQPQAPLLTQADSRQGSLALFSPHLRTGYLQQYSLTVQRELFRNTVIEAGLVGNRGVKLFMQENPDQLRIQDGFLQAFREVQAFLLTGSAVPATNSLVRLFGSANAAISGLGASTVSEGSVAAAADTLDRGSYTRYAAAGLSDFYLRNFPQYATVLVGANGGRSYYDSFQLSLRRHAGALQFDANYTLSKSIDTISTEGADSNRPIDTFNLRLNRALSDADRRHVFNTSLIYTMPLGRNRRFGAGWPRWLDSVLGGWDTGLLGIRESGSVFSVRSGRRTAGDVEDYANFTGDRNIGSVERRGDGVYWFSAAQIRQFSFPGVGEIGSSGRNGFRGPRLFNVDASLVKHFRLAERRAVVIRSEFYNMFNNSNFNNPGFTLATPGAFGKISATASGGAGSPVGGTSGGPRIIQVVLRLQF
jgi:hypothetical protein